MSSRRSNDAGATETSSTRVSTAEAADPREPTGPREPEHPISYWEERLIGKRLVSDEEKSDTDDAVCPFSTAPSVRNVLIESCGYLDFQEIGSSSSVDVLSWPPRWIISTLQVTAGY